ncbi:MAG: methyltransferase [Micromonosporaceae bacterium]|nr:methyltransferase [Micromonosporaceae bacterium]
MSVDFTVSGDSCEPATVKRLGNAFCAAKLLLAAAEVGVFTELEKGPVTAGQLAVALELHPRGVPDFLAALAALGLLVREDGRYHNSAAASALLVRGKPGNLTGYLGRADRMLYPAWGRLGAALRTGQPQADDGFATVTNDPVKRNSFLSMMDAVNNQLLPGLLAAYPWSRCHSVADIGGARGNVAARLALAHPQLSATVFDLPEIEPAAQAHLTALGVADRVRYQSGDFFTDPLPTADVLILGHVLHNWAPEERAVLVKKAHDAVRPGGAVLVYDAMLDPEPTDLDRILVSLNMLLVTVGGSEYTVDDCSGWLAAAGFGDIRATAVGAADTLVIGHKSA